MQRARIRAVKLMQKLDLHGSHVDARRTFALAAFARDAQVERLVELARAERVRSKLSGESEPQRIRAAARDVLLVACHAVRRAHRARIELATMAVVVAHLYGRREAAAAILESDFVLRPVEARGKV